MPFEPTITYRNAEHSPAVDELIRRRAQELGRFHDRIVGCDVVVEAPQKRRASGRIYHVRVTVRVPGPDVSVAGQASKGAAQQNLKLALNKAFTAAEHQLKESKRMMAGQEVKHHPPLRHGEITLLEPELGYGCLKADDGREVYFQRDSLVEGDWSTLAIGRRLRFREMDGEKGLFAVNVSVMA